MRVRAIALALIVVGVPVVAVSWYIAAHPGRLPWEFGRDPDRGAVLADAAEGADELRIRNWDGDVLFATTDAHAVRGFLDLVQIDEDASGDTCKCEGETEVQFLSRGLVTASFRVKEGSALTSGRLWSGDSHLTDDSANAVCVWLVAHGVEAESPRQRRARVEEETRVRDAAHVALLGAERVEALRACADREEVAALLEEWEPDIVERLVLAVRFVARESSRRASGAYDAGARAHEHVAGWLCIVDAGGAFVTAFDRLLADDSVAPGAAARFAELDRSDDWLPAEALARLRETAARRLLASGTPELRASGVRMLGRRGDSPEVRALVLGVLPSTDGAVRATEDHLEAASLLLRFCEPSLFPRIEGVANSAEHRSHWTDLIGRRIAARRDPAGVELAWDTMDVLRKAPIQGVVRAADGTVVAGATVGMSEPGSTPTVGEFFAPRLRAETDERGRFRLDVPVGRTWLLTVVHDDHPYLVRRDVDLREPLVQPLDLTLPKERTIRGRVVHPDGRPLAGAAVFATRQSPFDTHSHECGARSAEDGAFEIRGFDADAPQVHVTLHLHEPGRSHDSRTYDPHEFRIRPDDPPLELRVREPRAPAGAESR